MCKPAYRCNTYFKMVEGGGLVNVRSTIFIVANFLAVPAEQIFALLGERDRERRRFFGGEGGVKATAAEHHLGTFIVGR